MHAWSVTSGRNLFSRHVCVNNMTNDGARVLREASERLRQRFQVYFSTIRVEERCLSGEGRAEAIDITDARSERGS